MHEAISKTCASCFIRVSKRSKNNKIDSFLLFGNPNETLALVFEILHTFTEIKLSTDADINFSVNYIYLLHQFDNLVRD